MPTVPTRDARRRGGAMAVVLVILAVVVLIGAIGFGTYNGLVTRKEKVAAFWSEIDNQYKRRNDLVPNLVATVQGAANFEKSTLSAVTEARASVGRAQLPKDVPTDEKQLAAYINAKQGLSSALGRLFSVAENYPDFKASRAFLDLQNQLPDLRRLFIGEARATEVAEEQAVQEFHRHGLHKTKNATGVLLFVSLLERRVIVLGDEGIHAKVGDDHWTGTTKPVLDHIATGTLRDGLVAAIDRCGAVLAEHFPAKRDDVNELADRLIVRRE